MSRLDVHTLLCAAIVCCVGCNEPRSPSDQPPHLPRTYTEEEWGQLVHEGMTWHELTNTVGPPSMATTMGSNVTMALFWFETPVATERDGQWHEGYAVYLRNGTVEQWAPDYSYILPPLGSTSGMRSFGKKKLELFVLEAPELSGSEDLSPEQLQRLREEENIPRLECTAEVSAQRKGKSIEILITLDAETAASLGRMTKSAVGKNLLLLCGGKVLTSAPITDRLNSQRLILRTESSEVLKRLESR